MCVHKAHQYFTTDHSIPQAVYRSLVVPCPHSISHKDLVTIECFLAVVLHQHAVSQLIFIKLTVTLCSIRCYLNGYLMIFKQLSTCAVKPHIGQEASTMNVQYKAIYYQRAVVNMGEAISALDVCMLIITFKLILCT